MANWVFTSGGILFWKGNTISWVGDKTPFNETDFCVLSDIGSETARLNGREQLERLGFLKSLLLISPRTTCRWLNLAANLDNSRERLSALWSRAMAQGGSTDGPHTPVIRSEFSSWGVPDTTGALEGQGFWRVGSSVINGCFRIWEATIRWAWRCVRRWVK